MSKHQEFLARVVEDAGWGIAHGPAVEPYPGLEDACEDYLAKMAALLLGGDEGVGASPHPTPPL